VETNWSSYGELSGAKWVNAWDRGQTPTLYTSETADMGKFFINDWVKPVREYEDRLPDGLMENIEWIRPILEDAARGFDNIIYELPFGILPRNPIVARADHLEAAGFDPDSFSVTGYEDLIQKASKVQKDGPGDYGFQIFGSAYDWNDIMQVWAMAEYGKKGRLFNEDWSDVNYTNEAFMDMAKKYTEVYQEHGLSSPKTPQQADEPMVPAINQGTVSMSMPEWLNLPEFLAQAGDKVKDGTIRWYPMWEGDSGQRGMFGMYGIGITRGPPDADQKTIERRQEAAIDFMSQWFSKEFQKKLPQTMGVLPVREDVYDELEIPGAENNQIVDTAKTMVNSVKYAWEYHPNCSSVRAGIPGNYIGKMLNGSVSPEEAMNSMYDEAQTLSHVSYDKSEWKKP
jgi:ABC-type glycerol-3-phosphate transport system substrate-binding protein